MPSLTLTYSNSRFLHLPKTGGIWITECLKKCGIDFHTINPSLTCRGGHTGYHYGKHDGFSFSFIRNPFDWYRSYYKFLKQQMPHWGEENDLNEFVLNMIQHKNSLYELSKYYFGDNYEVSFIGKYENLCEDFIEALNFSSYPLLPDGRFGGGLIQDYDESISQEDGMKFNIDQVRDFSKIIINSASEIECDEYTDKTKDIIYSVDNYIFRRFKY